MNLEKKLDLWHEAGVIDAETRVRIAAFEHGRERPLLLYALGGLGALTIGIGIVSIIAANWDGIGRELKLGFDLLLGGLLAVALGLSATRGHAWLTDVVAAVYYVFVLASLALLGQVYQLGSPQHEALLAWSLATAPFMLLVRSRFVGLLWLSGLAWTHIATTTFLLDRSYTLMGHDDAWLANLVVAIAYVSFAAYIGIARAPWFSRARPQVSAGWTSALWGLWLCTAFGLGFVYYDEMTSTDTLSWSLAVAGAITLLLVAMLPRLYPDANPAAWLGMRAMLVVPSLLLLTGTTFAREELPAVGALAQIGVLGLAAWTVLQLGRVRAFNMLTSVIALRILIMYFEVFGSMLDTGLGMISGGLLTLLLAWLWKRKSPELASRLTARGDTHAA